MKRLPIDEKLPEICDRVGRDRRLVLVAEPGAGKTTRVAPALLRSGVLSPEHPRIVLLQPRRVAARAAASRIAEENGWAVGGKVGYRVRFEDRTGPDTLISVETEGILSRRMLADPYLEGTGAVILDEFHERSIHSDLAIALVRELADAVRDDLIIVVMSATMKAEPVARFLGDASIVRVEGRTFPVRVEYRGGFSGPSASEPREIAGRVSRAIEGASEASAGDILAFLPGAEEIRRSAEALAPWATRADSVVLPLFGSLPSEEQDRAVAADPLGRRKVVLATNIAETSLTIDGVTVVVDAGLARVARYDPERGLDRLDLERISRASADQRAGRAGRTAPGWCIRLWSEAEHRALAEADLAEVHRVDLSSTALGLRSWGQGDPTNFGWFEAPSEAAIEAAEILLTRLGAIDPSDRSITDLGRTLAQIPAHPRLARLLLGAARVGLVDQGAALAAILGERDLIVRTSSRQSRPKYRETSDVLLRLDLFEEAEVSRFHPSLRERGIDHGAARSIAQARDQFGRVGRSLRVRPEEHQADVESTLRRLLLLAYPDRVVHRRGADDPSGLMVGGRGVRLDRDSVVRDAEFFLAIDPRNDPKGPGRGLAESGVKIASEIELDWLEELFPRSIVRETTAVFDSDRRKVVGRTTKRYLDLPLREDRSGPVDADEAGRVLADALIPAGRAFLESNEKVGRYLDRIAFARRAMPELDWPTVDDETVRSWIGPICQGKRTEEEALRALSVDVIRSVLDYAQNRRLDDEVPDALDVPSGSRIKVEYPPDGRPMMAVRLQELFGWTETPRVALGRVPVLLQLLGPNFRPVQVTDDLQSFWTSTYFQVRKDLRMKYPRHSWPEEPLKAKAEAKGKHKRTT